MEKEKYYRYVFYLVIGLLTIMSLLLQIGWFWRIFFAIVFLGVGFTINAMEQAIYIPDDIPMSEEEEILQEEMEAKEELIHTEP